MDCPTCEAMVDAYVDGELPPSECLAFERALDGCPQCRQRLDTARRLSALVRELPIEPAPDLLHARIERELRTIAATTRTQPRRDTWRWSAMAASLLVAAGIGWLGANLVGQGAHEADQLVAGYMRVSASDTGVEIASSERHTVKPWFAGRIDYSPPVHDLGAEGFPLIGGRIDVVDGRKRAVLVYRYNNHRIALTVWPSASAGNAAPSVSQQEGFSLASWRHGGFEMRAIADTAPSRMISFAAALDRAIDADR